MKKIIALLLVMVMVLALCACGNTNPTTGGNNNPTTGNQPTTSGNQPTTNGNQPTTAPVNPGDGVLTYAEYMAAEMGTVVTVEFYVQATQSWWDNQITIYGQTAEGGYFAYNAACSQEDAAKLVPGTKIRVTGEKGDYQGEVEIMNATLEIVAGDTWIAEPTDVTTLLGTEELIKHQNKKVLFKGVTISKIEYRNGEPGDDIYVTVSYNGADYSFCVERYLTDPETDLYKAFETIKAGDVVDIEGFLYWYQGVNTHITGIAKAKTAHEIYMETEDGMEVTVEFYVQATQSWWDNQITIYGQTAEGGYFAYNAACSQEDAAKLVPGTKIRVTGEKGNYQGEVEIMNGTIEILAGDTWIAEATDVTALLGTEELIKHQNEKVLFKGVTISKIEYRNGEPGDDIYVTVSYNGADYSFCVERYLTGPETDLYKAFETIKAGDVVDIEGFLYWYQGVNTHITAISKVA